MEKRFKKIVSITLLSGMMSSSLVFATPQSIPNGPWMENEQNLSFSSFISNEDLYNRLKKIESSSQGKMKLEIAGYSDAINGDLIEKKVTHYM